MNILATMTESQTVKKPLAFPTLVSLCALIPATCPAQPFPEYLSDRLAVIDSVMLAPLIKKWREQNEN